jgi:ribosomal protein S20
MFKTVMSRATEFKDAIVKNFQSQVEQNADKLDLAPQQVEEVKTIIRDMADKGFKKMVEMLQQGKLDQMRSAGEELMNEFDEKVKQVLQPDQIEKWKELDPGFKQREERRQKKAQEPRREF